MFVYIAIPFLLFLLYFNVNFFALYIIFTFQTISLASSFLPFQAMTYISLQITKLPNGVRVASVDNGGPISNVSLAVRAGSRYESAELKGIGHLLKNAMFMTNNSKTNLRMTREMQLIGGSLGVSSWSCM